MSERRDQLTRREAEAWAEFEELTASIDRERREEPGLENGWSVKDLLWHVAYWWGDLATQLAEIRGGTYEEIQYTSDQTNATNAEVLALSRSMTLADVEAEVVRARERVLAAWAALSEIGHDAAENFSSETIEHYEEHLPDLRAFAAR